MQTKKLVLSLSLFSLLIICGPTLASENAEPAQNKTTQSEINAIAISKRCFSSSWGKQALLELKSKKFLVADNKLREKLAFQLLNCLASTDPLLRDGVAYEALANWLRKEQLPGSSVITMIETLTQALAPSVADPNGVYQPFAALVLSEMARADAKHAYLNESELENFVKAVTGYLAQLSDYRGFNDNDGWRHGVAHSADVLLQLSQNPKINQAQLAEMLNVIASKVSPEDTHFYTFGEPRRLAMAVVYIFLRGEQTMDDWQDWLTQITDAAPLAQWPDAYKSEAGLAKLHNTQQFLYATYALIKASENTTLQAMVPDLESALVKVN